MGKDKLRKFRETETFRCLLQPATSEVLGCDHPIKGNWGRTMFGNDNPIVLELGCGRGEYTVGLARRFPDKNFIGVDIKGSRMWHGAREAQAEGMKNVAFLRTNIEFIHELFAANEVEEIWLTFSDPQMKKATKRLTSTYFMERYRKFLIDGGLVHVKTDSNFMFTYTKYITEVNNLPVVECIDDVHGQEEVSDVLQIRTYYESQWLSRGITIKYIAFNLPSMEQYAEPDVEIELDEYRSYGRSKRSSLETTK